MQSNTQDIERNLLLVDDEANILRALKRVFRRDQYNIHLAEGGEQALQILEKTDCGVIVSDQRMPNMCGTEFLAKAKVIAPNSIRIILSGYTDLKSITEAINEGSVYKFFTKPWDDEQIRRKIREAFELYEVEIENKRLNHELKEANKQLSSLIEKEKEYANVNLHLLQVAQSILQEAPTAIVGIDDNGMVVILNQQAQNLFSGTGVFIGANAYHVLPEPINKILDAGEQDSCHDVVLEQQRYRVHYSELSGKSSANGKMLFFEKQNDR